MSFLAFVPAVMKVSEPVVETVPSLPTFKPRWWYSSRRLDARPVIWSLQNHPEEWALCSTRLTITHAPSHHTFWAFSVCRGLYSAGGCGCETSEAKFQLFQHGAYKRALRAWGRAVRAPVDRERFASHFVR